MPTDPNNERYVHDFADGEYGWGEGTATKDGYQDIIDQLEHDVPVVAPESEIEQYRSLPGRRFIAEDTARGYIGDGSAWVQVASRGPNPTFESAEVNGLLRSEEILIGDSPAVSDIDGKNLSVDENDTLNSKVSARDLDDADLEPQTIAIGSERPIQKIGSGLDIFDGELVLESAVIGDVVPSGTTTTIATGDTTTMESIVRCEGHLVVDGKLEVQ